MDATAPLAKLIVAVDQSSVPAWALILATAATISGSTARPSMAPAISRTNDAG